MKEKIYIGVAWPYANGSLHLGHMAGCYLPADIFARFCRMKCKDVLMVSGSDEHGTPITISAEKEKTTPKAIVDRYHIEHKENMKKFGISFDLFTRTTTKNHEKVVQDVFLNLYNKGHIYKKNVEAFYCTDCCRFLPDRYIEGVCPHCDNEKARGDQCDECGKILDSQDLINVKCKICKSTPELKKSDHLFIALSNFENKLLEWMKDNNHWKSSVRNFTQNWLKNGLKDRAITRDMEWGIKVPVEGFDNKRIYVWFDAVIGYLSASKEWSQKIGFLDKWEEWWKDKDTKHYYFLAKDNIPFHSLIWPSMLIGYDNTLNLPYDIPANEYLCLKGEQFSKSKGLGIFITNVLDKFEADAIRYYLSINMPENKDSNWLWDDFIAKNNDELVGTYGNFVHRVITFTQKNFCEIPNQGMLDDLDRKAIIEIEKTSHLVGNALENCRFKKGLRAVMNLAQFGNYYFDQKQPWILIKSDKDKCATTLHICLKIVNALAIFMAPFLPFSSDVIWGYLGHTDSVHKANWNDALSDLIVGFTLEIPKPIFNKLLLKDFVSKVDPFSNLDLRVAKVIDVKDHPQADKLYILQVDLGVVGKRILVAGVKKHYKKEEIIGKNIVIVVNLKPAIIRGIKSYGMLLAAADESGFVSLIITENADPGSEIFIKGIPREPVNVLEFDDFKQVNLIVNEEQKVEYLGKTLQSDNGNIYSDKEVKKGSKIS